MELRVPGIGGPDPESVLGCAPNHAVPTWRSQPSARSMVRHAAGQYDVHVYDWRPLTSGSRSFAVWPLLAPFTFVNVAGWMGPPDRRRGWLHRWASVLIGITVTVQCVVWLIVASVNGWRVYLDDDARRVAYWAGVGTAVVAMGLLVLGATYMASGFERYRPSAWTDPPAGPSWRHPWGRGITMTTVDERFYDSGAEHRAHWRVHVVVAIATAATTVALALGGGGAGNPWRGLDRAIVAAGAAPFVAIAVLVLVALPPDSSGRPLTARLAGAGAATLGVMLLGGLVSAAMIAVVGIEHVPTGPAMMLFELYGWVAFAVLALAGLIVLFAAQTRSAAERSPLGAELLGSSVARLRARVAPTVARVDVILALVAVGVPVAAALLSWVRWFHHDHGERWRLTASLGVSLGRWTVFAVAALMIVNLVKSRANPAALRRIGNLWDIVTFWPRSYHPFAVRPYAERAVPELREFLLHAPSRGPLVVTAHSQGSVLVFAAIEPVLADVRGRLELVTFGSPLRSLHRRFFPRCFAADRIAAVHTTLGSGWRNVFRCTDHVGRAVFADDAEALATYASTRRVLRVDLPDRPIADPSPTDPALEGHNRYWEAAEVRAAVARMVGNA